MQACSSEAPRSEHKPPHLRGREVIGAHSAAAAASAPPAGGNIVPFTRWRQRAPNANDTAHRVAREAAAAAAVSLPLAAFDAGLAEEDPRPLLLFDMNGTLTSHTAARRSAGRNLPRPGTPHLRRLAERFRLGVFTSATIRTVTVAADMLEAAAGPGPPLFDRRFILHREHTLPMGDVGAHVAAGGKAWDTIKPLHLFFSRLHRTVVVDDDAYKAAPGEQANMVLVPRWEEDDPRDGMLEHIVDALLALADKVGDDPEADVRPHTAAASAALAAIADRQAAAEGQQGEQEVVEPAAVEAQGSGDVAGGGGRGLAAEPVREEVEVCA